jgi:hypothetical protein
VVNMNELVNIVASIQKEIQGTHITLTLEENHLHITGPAGSLRLRLVQLYRPSSADVLREAAPDALLVLMTATQKAAQAAAPFNYVVAPDGGYRIVAPGVALSRQRTALPEVTRQVRLAGRTGVIAESLLLGRERGWSVQELATSASVSTALSHRVITRLEGEGQLLSQGNGPEKTRRVANLKALAELWSEEEKEPTVALRGYLYGSSTEALARQILGVYPEAAVGGVLAANLYRPVLTKVAPPLRIWIPGNFDSDHLQAIGFQATADGANIEFVQSKDDPWNVHRNVDGITKVSSWRAWREISHLEGRVRELADSLLNDLGG